MVEQTEIQNYPKVLIDFHPKIPALKKIKEKSQVDIRYCLISPFAFAHIHWDPKIYEIVYDIEEPILTEKEAKDKEIVITAMKDLINFDHVIEKDQEALLEYIDKRFKFLATELGMDIPYESYRKIYYYLCRDFMGFNETDPLLRDYYVEDIECNGANVPVYVVHRVYRNLKTSLKFPDMDTLANFVEKLAQRCSKYISYAKPILDGSLPDGSRVNATYTKDITSKGPTFTIRKFTKTPWTPTQLLAFNTLSPEMLAYIWILVQYGMNILITGGTSSGKTTLLNTLVGVLKPEQGDVLILNKDGTVQSVFKNQDLVKKRIGFSTQNPSFYEKLTVAENLEHFGRLYRINETDLIRRINSLLDLVGLKEAKNATASKLSGGMQKRLDIASALLNDPDILVLDEPTADLDPILRKQLWELIRQINLKGTTILLASHFLAEIELLCTRIAILQNKRIIELGTADELRNIYSRNYEIYVETTTKEYDKIMDELKTKKQYFANIKKDGTELLIETPHPENILPMIANHAQKYKDLQSLHMSKPTLGKVFESMVKR